MTELNLLYGSEDNLMSDSIDRNDSVYSSKVSGQQLHKMASQNDVGYEDKIAKQQMLLQQQQQQQLQKQQQQIQVQPPPMQNTLPTNQQNDNQNTRRRVEYNFMDRMNHKKTEVFKLALFSLVIVLGISIDRIITHYLSKYVGDNILTDFQELLLRFSYPIGIFLLLWIFKAI